MSSRARMLSGAGSYLRRKAIFSGTRVLSGAKIEGRKMTDMGMFVSGGVIVTYASSISAYISGKESNKHLLYIRKTVQEIHSHFPENKDDAGDEGKGKTTPAAAVDEGKGKTTPVPAEEEGKATPAAGDEGKGKGKATPAAAEEDGKATPAAAEEDGKATPPAEEEGKATPATEEEGKTTQGKATPTPAEE